MLARNKKTERKTIELFLFFFHVHLPASSDSIGDSTADDSAVNEDAWVVGGMPAVQQVGGNVLAVVEDVTAVCCCCAWTIA